MDCKSAHLQVSSKQHENVFKEIDLEGPHTENIDAQMELTAVQQQR